MKTVWLFVIALTVVALTPISANADEAGPSKGQFYISPGVAYHHGPDTSRYGFDDIESSAGLAVGYAFSDRWAIELLGSNINSRFENSSGSGKDEAQIRHLNLLYSFSEDGNWQPYFIFGASENEYNFDGVRASADSTEVNAGFGAFYQFNDYFAFRFDVRAAAGGRQDNLAPTGFVGLTAFLGGDKTPPPPPPDSDGDGVPNDQDKCPTTPPGRVVDAEGCEFDGDGDGVVDAEDRCPETPAGVAVDSRGCALDTDGDGVPDYRDDCPDTSAGALVDERGCYIELEEAVTIDMNIEFDVDSAEILPKHSAEIGRVVTFLRQYPTANAVIEGHTDSSGSRAYNQALSERRAKSVRDYLVSSGNVAEGRLTHAGYGEDRPIADNETTAGKQKNRRVSAVVTGTQTVRKTREDQ